MNINISNSFATKKLSEISAGDTFVLGSDIYIKTSTVDSDRYIIVVNLNTGEECRYTDNNVIIPVELDVSLKSKDLHAPIYGKSWW